MRRVENPSKSYPNNCRAYHLLQCQGLVGNILRSTPWFSSITVIPHFIPKMVWGHFGGYLQAGNFWVIFVVSPNVSGENFLGKNGGPNLGLFPPSHSDLDPRSFLNKFTGPKICTWCHQPVTVTLGKGTPQLKLHLPLVNWGFTSQYILCRNALRFFE